MKYSHYSKCKITTILFSYSVASRKLQNLQYIYIYIYIYVCVCVCVCMCVCVCVCVCVYMHTHTRLFFFILVTFHRRNGFYTVQPYFLSPLHQPYT